MTTFSQRKMRPVEDLINTSDPGWPLVKSWIDSAKNKIEILPVDTTRAKTALFQTQITTRSPMGAIIYMTGGYLLTMAGYEFLDLEVRKLLELFQAGIRVNHLKKLAKRLLFY